MGLVGAKTSLLPEALSTNMAQLPNAFVGYFPIKCSSRLQLFSPMLAMVHCDLEIRQRVLTTHLQRMLVDNHHSFHFSSVHFESAPNLQNEQKKKDGMMAVSEYFIAGGLLQKYVR